MFGKCLKVLLAVLVTALLLCSSVALAQSPLCESWNSINARNVNVGLTGVNGSMPNLLGENRFRVNYDSLAQLNGMTQNEALTAIIRSSEQWNNYANAGWFKYVGTTTATDLLNSDGTCSNVDSNIVRVAQCSARGNVTVRCNNSRWVLTICVPSGQADNWSTGEVLSGELDINSTLTHEFGHVVGLWHPGESFISCSSNSQCSSGMCSNVCTNDNSYCGNHCVTSLNGTGIAASTMPTVNATSLGYPMLQRQLYPNDIECAEQVIGRRSVKLIANRYAGTFFSSLTAQSNLSRGGGVAYREGVSQNSFTTTDTASVKYDRYHRIGHGYSNFTTSTSFLNSFEVGVGPAGGWWLDSIDRLRFFYNTDTSSFRFTDWYSYFDVFQFNYDRALTPGNVASGYMTYCANSSCSYALPVKSSTSISTTHDNYSGQELFAWTDQNRLSDNHKINISVGRVSDFKVNLPNNLPLDPGGVYVKSETGVQIACGAPYSAGFQNDYDCIAVYTKTNDSLFRIRTRPFYVNGSNIVWGPEHNTLLPSVAETAAWYSDGSFWIASKNSFGNVTVHKSINGVSWGAHSSLGFSINAPKVAYLNQEAHGDDDVTVYLTRP